MLKTNYNPLVLLALPIILLVINNDWIFTPLGTLDPWYYTGYFLNFQQHYKIFGPTYFVSRLPWILPGYITYQLFSPLVANYVLHLSFYYIAIFSLYLTLKIAVSRRAALFASVLIGSYSYFLSSMGWDYVDGAGITYFLLTILMLTLSARSSYWKLTLYFSGVFFVSIIYTNLFLINLAPAIIIYYLAANNQMRKNPFLTGMYLFVGGILSITVLLGLISYIINGDFLFFLPHFRFALENAGNQSLWWKPLSLYKLIIMKPYLKIPFLAFVGSSVISFFFFTNRLSQKYRFIINFQLLFSVVLLTWVFLDLAGYQPDLQLSYYASYIIPSMFLAIGSQFAVVLDRLEKSQYPAIYVSIIIFFLPLAFTDKNNIVAFIKEYNSLILIVFALLWMIFIILSIKNKKYYLLLIAACLSYSFFNLNSYGFLFGESSGIKKDMFLVAIDSKIGTGKDGFLSVVDSTHAIREIAPDGKVKFWYSEREHGVEMFISIASSYLLLHVDNVFSTNFPLARSVYFPQIKDFENANSVNPDTKVIILSKENNALQMANENLAKIGFRANLLSRKTIENGGFKFNMFFVRLEKDSGRNSS